MRPARPKSEPLAAQTATNRDFRIDALLFRRIARLFLPFWARRSAWLYWIGLAVVLGQAALISFLTVRSTFAMKDLTNALVRHRWGAFEDALLAYIILFGGGQFLPSLTEILNAWICRSWRIWLTERVVQRYLANRTYYDIAQRGQIDNPDQRIQESLSILVFLFFGLPATLVGQIATLAAAVAVLGSIDGRLVLGVSILAFTQCIATYVGYVPLVRLRHRSIMSQAELRYSLANVRTHAEAIAFYEGETVERAQIHSKVALSVKRELISALFQRLVTDATPILATVAWGVLPYIVLAPRFFAGQIDVGTVTQGIAVSVTVMNAVEGMMSILAPFASVAPHAVRVAQISERFDAVEAEQSTQSPRRIEILIGDDVRLEDVCLETPGGEQQLAQHLSLSLAQGDNLVIVGQTGVGKSSLLRAMAGLWDRGAGKITMPPVDECLFLPQQPYMTLADLRAQLLYPQSPDLPDDQLLRALDAVCLPNLAAACGGLSAVHDWGKVLSLGEQQRIAFARVLIARPSLVLLDEATSAVDFATESHLYRTLAATGARFVSVGHRVGIIEHHTQVLTLRPDGGWSLDPIAAMREPAA
ncbi:MAG TPA: ATP-binding cassette domain-containing protein [Caulobacteraceae bacterium]|jgi:putative ATP-binding cassette transporter|nr:ATP-binding cassette domain-containing protein [Caulobacteraceae bacterium]